MTYLRATRTRLVVITIRVKHERHCLAIALGFDPSCSRIAASRFRADYPECYRPTGGYFYDTRDLCDLSDAMYAAQDA